MSEMNTAGAAGDAGGAGAGGAGGAAPRDQGMALLRLGKFAEAAAALRRAVEANPNDETAWRLLGGALASRGDQAGAVQAFERSVALAPNSAKSHYNLGVALQAVGQSYEAKSHLEQALAIDPNYEHARTTLEALAKQSLERGYGDPTAAPEDAPSSLPGLGRLAVPNAPTGPDNDLAPVGGQPVGGAGGGTTIGGRMAGTDDLSPVGGPGGPSNPYGTPPPPPGAASLSAASSEGTSVPNLRPSPPMGPGPVAGGAYAPTPVLGMNYGRTDNTSGMQSTVPPEIAGGWNWGAFQFNWIWLANHKLGLAAVILLVLGVLSNFWTRRGSAGLAGTLLVFAVDIGIRVWMGINGNRLAWRHRHFQSIEDFKACQRIWMYWAIPFLVIYVIVLVLAVVGAVALTGMRGALPTR